MTCSEEGECNQPMYRDIRLTPWVTDSGWWKKLYGCPEGRHGRRRFGAATIARGPEPARFLCHIVQLHGQKSAKLFVTATVLIHSSRRLCIFNHAWDFQGT